MFADCGPFPPFVVFVAQVFALAFLVTPALFALGLLFRLLERWASRTFDRLTTRWGLLAVLLAMPLPLAAEASDTALPQVDNCYAFEVMEPIPGSLRLGFLDQAHSWWQFFCPAGEQPVLQRRSVLHDVAEELARVSGPDPAWWAGDLGQAPAEVLERRLCQAVTYTRSIDKYQRDPRPHRNRPAKEIQAWLLDLTGPSRPPQAQLLRPLVQSWSPKDLKRWHDRLKAAWPQVAAVACPDMETQP